MPEKKAHLYEALFLVNQGIDQAVSAALRLKKSQHAFEEVYHKSIAGLERRRALINGQFMLEMSGQEEDDSFFYNEEFNRWLSDDPLDAEEVYKLVRFLEQQRKTAGEPPRVQFLKVPKKKQPRSKVEERAIKDATPKPTARLPKKRYKGRHHKQEKRENVPLAA